MRQSCLVRWLAGWVGPLGLAAGCVAPAGGQVPAGATRPGVAQTKPAGPFPLRKTVPTPGASRGSGVGSSVVVARVRLPGTPRYQVPQVRLPSAAAARRINATLTRRLLTANLEDTARAATATEALRRARAAYEGNGQTGIFSTSYDVLLNRTGLLSLALTVEYMGAYPWTATQHVVFAVQTGRLLTVADLLADTLALRQRWHRRINQRVAAHLRAVAQQYPADSAALADVREHTGWRAATRRIPARDLPPLREFALTPQGLVLYTQFEFPHVVLALSPNNEYRFSYAQVLPWAAPRSLLQQMRC